MDGVTVGERSWSRELFAIRVEGNQVREEVPVPGDPYEWEAGWDDRRTEEHPWLAPNGDPGRPASRTRHPSWPTSRSCLLSLQPQCAGALG